MSEQDNTNTGSTPAERNIYTQHGGPQPLSMKKARIYGITGSVLEVARIFLGLYAWIWNVERPIAGIMLFLFFLLSIVVPIMMAGKAYWGKRDGVQFLHLVIAYYWFGSFLFGLAAFG